MLNLEGYALIRLPLAGPDVLVGFENLPLDPYCGGEQRYRRFSQYRLFFDGAWRIERLPHRPFVQGKDYNKYVGGILRYFQPLKCDPLPQVAALANEVPLSRVKDWQINVHQVRIVSDGEITGVVVPEGSHQDGHHYAALWVVDRNNITGGVTSLYPLDSDMPLFQTTIAPSEALVFDDQRVRHFTTDIRHAGGWGCRDCFIIVFNPWDAKRYGEDFERGAAARRPVCGQYL